VGRPSTSPTRSIDHGASPISRPKIWRRVLQLLMPPAVAGDLEPIALDRLTRCKPWLPLTRHGRHSRHRTDVADGDPVICEGRDRAELTAVDLAGHAAATRAKLHGFALREPGDRTLRPARVGAGYAACGTIRHAGLPRCIQVRWCLDRCARL
jgi:hypothetical protein